MGDSEIQYKHILDNLLEGVQIISPDFKYIYVNSALAEQSKYSESELTGYTMMEKYPGIEKTDVFASIKLCLTNRMPVLMENEFEFPDKSKGWFQLNIQPVPEGVIVFSVDITARKKAEEKLINATKNYRELFNKSCNGIIVYDVASVKALEVNIQLSEISGYTQEELLNDGMLVFTLSAPEYSIDKLNTYFKNAVAGTPQIFEWKNINKKGDIVWYEVTLKNASIAGEDRILAFFNIINNRIKVQEELLLLNEKLEEIIEDRTAQLLTVNKELESFSYSVSHDLRAPLRALNGYSKVIEEDYGHVLDDEAKRLLGNIQYYSKKMGQLVDDLLAFSKMGKKELTRADINMEKMVTDILTEIKSTAPFEAKVILHKIYPAHADPSLMQQVWVNLISNAIKYSSKKAEPVIEVGSEIRKNEICYYVKDNGAGFDMKYSSRLFGVFQRLHAPEDFEGTGIGLAIAQRILVKHNGKIWFYSEPDNGATFYFTLPVTNNLN